MKNEDLPTVSITEAFAAYQDAYFALYKALAEGGSLEMGRVQQMLRHITASDDDTKTAGVKLILTEIAKNLDRLEGGNRPVLTIVD